MITAGILASLVGGSLVRLLTARGWRASRERDAHWRWAAGRLGLRFHGSGEGRRLEGPLGRGSVELWGGGAVAFAVLRGFPIPRSVTLRARRGTSPVRGLFRPDRAFDDRASVEGPEGAALAALGDAARGAVVGLMADGIDVEIEDGRLALLASREEVAGGRALEALVGRALEAARALSVDSIPDSLAAHALADRSEGLRARSLEVLLRDHADSPPASRAREAGLKDPSPQVRCAAALGAGEAGFAVLTELVRDEGRSPEVRGRALRGLAEACHSPWVAELVVRSLRSPCQELLQAAIGIASAERDLAAVRPLSDLVERWLADGREAAVGRELGLAVAEALGRMPHGAGEPALIRMLGRMTSDVRRAAVATLGEMGTVRAVEPLLALTRGPLQSGMGEAAREAIRRIQARLGDVGAGRLSVLPLDGGLAGLSLSEEGGGLALAGRSAGRDGTG